MSTVSFSYSGIHPSTVNCPLFYRNLSMSGIIPAVNHFVAHTLGMQFVIAKDPVP